MKLLIPFGTILLAITLRPTPVRAQDSPIVINDNGGIPLGGADTARPRSKTAPQSGVHIHHDMSSTAGGIHTPPTGTTAFSIEDPTYIAACLTDDVNGVYLPLPVQSPWEIDLSDGTKLINGPPSPGSPANQHIEIDPGAGMKVVDNANLQNSPTNRLTSVTFLGLKSPGGTPGGVTLTLPTNSVTIHYCGLEGCAVCPGTVKGPAGLLHGTAK